MVFRAALILVPMIALAQAPPPEVDQALRARVTEFFQCHVDGTFFKAIDLVADDTKDYYVGASKNRFKSFKIDSIAYSGDGFTRATVKVTGQRVIPRRADFPEVVISQDMTQTWIVEHGKWVWHYDQKDEWLTPMGPSDLKAINGSSNLPRMPDVSPAAMAVQAQNILKKVTQDKTDVILGTSTTAKVVFHNGEPGSISLALDPAPKLPGFSASLDKSSLNAGGDATLTLRYQPEDNAPRPVPFTVRVIAQPFNVPLQVSVKFDAAP